MRLTRLSVGALARRSWTWAGCAAGMLGLATAVACSSDSSTDVNAVNRVALIAVSLSSPSITIGQQTQANVTLQNSHGVTLSGKSIKWTSANSAVASVDPSTGMITGVGVGSTSITAKADGASGSVNVSVIAPPPSVTSVHVTLSSSSLTIGAQSQATAVVTDGSGKVMTGQTVTWSSANAAVATVDPSSGMVTAVAAGSASIVATVGTVTGSADVTVTPVPVASVAVALAAGSIAVGSTTQATATARDASGIVLTGRAVTWSSSDPTIAKIDGSTGIVTGVAAGTVTISATSEGKTGSATLTVTAASNPGNPGNPPPPPPPPAPVATVSVSLTSGSIVVGGSAQGTATTKDSVGNVLTGRTITWSSSNSSVASVSSSGLVTAVSVGSATITATSEGKSGGASITVTLVPVSTVTVSLAASSIQTSATTQATATTRDNLGNVLTGRVITWSSSNTAVATVSSSGLVTGVTAGTATISATSEGKTGGATITVTVPPPVPVATVTVSLAASSLLAGATTQATATTTDASGNVLTGRTITWSSSATAVATVSSTGLVTSVAAGTASITATSEGKTGSATLTVTAPAPVATQLAVTAQPSATAQSGVVLAQQPAVQLRTAANVAVPQSGVVVTVSVASGTPTLGGTLTATTNASGVAMFTNLSLTGSGAATLKFSATGLTAATSSSVTVSSGSGSGGTLLFQEHFDDTNFGSRGWYDLPGGGITSLSTTNHAPGSTSSLQVNFAAGGVTPSPSTGARHLFTPSASVYATYWIKYSTNWVGSGEAFHPHEFYIITNQDDQFVGPAVTHLTLYMEENFQSAGGYAVLKTQDASNIDTTHLNVDLTNITENRAVSGCNGNSDGTPTDCYLNGNAWNNEKTWKSASAVFLNSTTSPAYKSNWHQVAVYFQMNSIVGGKGQNDGVAQYWFDGQLVIDQHNVLFRTGAHPNMLFNQFLMAPYIGDGSPVAQQMWIDELVVSTAPPS